MKYIVVLIIAFTCGCNEPAEEYERVDPMVWVCHNPGSSQHGERCQTMVDTIRGEYETCYWILDGSHYGRGHKVRDSFCWLLERNDCYEPLEHEWQNRNCHLLQGDN